MDNEQVIAAIMTAVCCFGCAALFYGLGVWALKSKKTMGFWAGKQLDPERVSDIPAFNQSSAVMWKVYSVRYWLSGLLACFGVLGDGYIWASVILLFAACFPGIIFLIAAYRKIEKRYIRR